MSSLWGLIFTVIYKITLSCYKLFYLKVVKRKLKLVLLENDSRLSRFCEMRFLWICHCFPISENRTYFLRHEGFWPLLLSTFPPPEVPSANLIVVPRSLHKDWFFNIFSQQAILSSVDKTEGTVWEIP